ncbi:MAG: class II glutamine amidotransferase [Bacteroidetes bacterium QH_7_62_13]|nr:MAG: class II glutamine amidotransferase [Bacteroidetes bacterium QH_7_62_13]
MCRLYALQATHPTCAACELLDAQNDLLDQSQEDTRGLSNPHGWGMASLTGGTAHCVRQVDPATESNRYREQSLRLEGTTLLAHIRRATVGDPSLNNTHPFRNDAAFLIHNGHVPAFKAVRPRLLARLSDEHRHGIRGTTDSEHIFALLLQLREEAPDAPIHTITRRAVHLLQSWCDEEAPDAVQTGVSPVPFDDLDTVADAVIHDTLALNLLWTDGTDLGGARLNRSLWALRRTGAHICPTCGDDHTDAPESASYRATVLASERITDEDWTKVPNGSVFHVGGDGAFDLFPLTP